MAKRQYKTSLAQRRANKRYRQRHHDRFTYQRDRNTAKKFILKEAHSDDLSLVYRWLLKAGLKSPTYASGQRS